MSARSARRFQNTLVAGVALLGCSLASTAHGQLAMNFTSFDAGSGSLSIGSLSGGFSVTGPTSSLSQSTPYLGGNAYLNVDAFNLGFLDFDIVRVKIGYADGTTALAGSATGSFTLSFSTRVVFGDFGSIGGGSAATWSVNSTVLADGDIFEIGTYEFFFSNSGPFAFAQNSLMVGASFSEAPATAIPLPGAAGLAACGLLGLGRRRRR